MTILVTGGSKGIGRGICLRFASPDNDVFINYAHDDGAAEETAQAVRARGARAHLVRGDVSTPEGAARVLAAVSNTVSQLDQLVHGAVDPYSARTLDLEPKRFLRAVELNGCALLYLVQAAQPLLRSGSSVTFLSSRGAKVAVPQYAAIGVAKALAESLVRYLAVELAPGGIRVNTVIASAVLTDAFRAAVPEAEVRFSRLAAATPTGRSLDAEDIAAAVAFLASSEAHMITGTELVIDGGLYVKS